MPKFLVKIDTQNEVKAKDENEAVEIFLENIHDIAYWGDITVEKIEDKKSKDNSSHTLDKSLT